MRMFNMNVAGVVASALLFGFSSSVSAERLFVADPVGLQFEREVRSTYIVRLASNLPAQAVNARASEITQRFGGRVKYVYTNTINGFAITIPEVALANMLRAGGLDIVSVTRDGIVSIDAKPSNPGGGKGKDKDGEGPVDSGCTQVLPWGVARVTGITAVDDNPCLIADDKFVPADGEPEIPNYDRNDLRVCVIDTGVDRNHPDLNVSGEWKFTAFTNEGFDDKHGHGSHVAGTIGAIANNFGVVGVAPNASIISVKVLNRRGSGTYTGVIAGIDAMAAETTVAGPVCAVANMSLGGPVSDALVKAVKCTAASTTGSRPSYCSPTSTPSGIVFTLAAGNASDDAANHSPANASTGLEDNIHTIAAMDSSNAWAWFSNYGPPVDYIEPGVSIQSTFKNAGYKTYNGTSMAAPHMAGLVLRELVNDLSTISVAEKTVPHNEFNDTRDYPIAVDK